MKNELPTLVDPYLYATQGKELSGVINFSSMERFSAMTKSAEQDASYKLLFCYDPDHRCCIQGNATIEIKLECARCLQLFSYIIDANFQLYPVANGAADNLSKQLEIVELQDGVVSVVDIVEDELILSLPMAQVHADLDPSCRSQPAVGTFENNAATEQKNPFALLKNISVANVKQ